MEKILCFECGSDENIHNHHVVPKIKGGTKTIPLCQLCHTKVHGDHMLKIQRLAWLGRKRKEEEHIEKGLDVPLWGRPKGTEEDMERFLSKPKNKVIIGYLKRGMKINEIVKIIGCSNKTVIKVKRLVIKK